MSLPLFGQLVRRSWAVLFPLRRTDADRFSNIETSLAEQESMRRAL
jgi:hypothetical protein